MADRNFCFQRFLLGIANGALLVTAEAPPLLVGLAAALHHRLDLRPDTVALEKRISDGLGLAVNIDHREPGGTVHIRYRDLDQLDEITRRLNVKN